MAFAYEGLKDSGTFRVNATTVTAVTTGGKITDLIGKAVAWVSSGDDDPMVGYGSANDWLAGIVTAVQPENQYESDKYVATVAWRGIFRGLATAAETTTAVVGKGVVVDGAGGVAKSTTVSNAVCASVNGTDNTCTIKM